MARNVPVTLANPNAPVYKSDIWLELSKLTGGSPDFTAVEIKALYVIGLIDDICQSVDWLLKASNAWPEKYLPAFSLFASGVDLLGRCLTGNRTLNVNENLRTGFWYLFHPAPEPPPRSLNPADATAVLVTTPDSSYTADNLVALRHYSSHGQAAVDNLPNVDNKLLEQFPRPIGDAIETYWTALQNNAEYCRRLGDALIDPYANRVEPLKKTLHYFDQGLAAGDLFYRLNWQV